MTAVGPSPRVAQFPQHQHDSPSPYATPLLTVRNLDGPSDTIQVVSAWRSALLSPSPSPKSRRLTMGEESQDGKPAPAHASTERGPTTPVYRSPPPLPRLDTTPIRDLHHSPRQEAYPAHHSVQARPRTTPTGALVYPTPVSVTEGNPKAYGVSPPQHSQRPPHPELRPTYTRAQIAPQTTYSTPLQHHTPSQSPEDHPAYYRAHWPRAAAPAPEVRAAPSPYSPFRSGYLPPSIRGTPAAHPGHANHHSQESPGLSPYGLTRPKLSIHPYAPPRSDARDVRDARYHSAGASRHAPLFGGVRDWAGPGSAISPGAIKAPRKRADDLQIAVLTQSFEKSAYPSTEERDALARELGMTSRSVQIWFQNRRRALKVEQQSAIQRAEAEARAAVAVPPYLSHLSHQLMTPARSVESRHRASSGIWYERPSPSSSSITARGSPYFGSPQSRVPSTSYGLSEPRKSITSPKRQSAGYPTPLATKAEALTIGERGYEAFEEEDRKPSIHSHTRTHSGGTIEAGEWVSPTGIVRKSGASSGLVGRFFNDPRGTAQRGEGECSPESEPVRRAEEVDNVNMP